MLTLPAYTLSVTKEQLALLSAAIGELPFKLAAPLVSALDAQVHAQEKAAADKVSASRQAKHSPTEGESS